MNGTAPKGRGGTGGGVASAPYGTFREGEDRRAGQGGRIGGSGDDNGRVVERFEIADATTVADISDDLHEIYDNFGITWTPFRRWVTCIGATVLIMASLVVLSAPTTSVQLGTVTDLGGGQQRGDGASHSRLRDLGINTTRSRPNVVLITADNLAYTRLGNANHELEGVTPLLDMMAKDGITLNTYYTESHSTAARAALLAGKHASALGMQWTQLSPESVHGLPVQYTLLPEHLRKHGYSTHMLGSWRLGHSHKAYLPTARGFDTFLGSLVGQESYTPSSSSSTGSSASQVPHIVDFLRADTTSFGAVVESDEHHENSALTVLMREFRSVLDKRELDLLRAQEIDGGATQLPHSGSIASRHEHHLRKQHQQRQSQAETGTPFFLYVALPAPLAAGGTAATDSETAPALEWVSKADIADIKSRFPRHQRNKALTLRSLEKVVGGLQRELQLHEEMENTIFIVASSSVGCNDGAPLGTGANAKPLKGKPGSLYEGAFRADAFIWSRAARFMPTAMRGQKYGGPMHVTDWLPTILSLAGATTTTTGGSATGSARAEHEGDGVDHSALLRGSGTTAPLRRSLLLRIATETAHPSLSVTRFAIRHGNYKMLREVRSGGDVSSLASCVSEHDSDTLESSTDEIVHVDGTTPIHEWRKRQSHRPTDLRTYVFNLHADPFEAQNVIGAIPSQVRRELDSLAETYASAAKDSVGSEACAHRYAAPFARLENAAVASSNAYRGIGNREVQLLPWLNDEEMKVPPC